VLHSPPLSDTCSALVDLLSLQLGAARVLARAEANAGPGPLQAFMPFAGGTSPGWRAEDAGPGGRPAVAIACLQGQALFTDVNLNEL